MIRMAFDIGGTFTDFVLVAGGGRAASFLKVPTTPHDPSEAVVAGFERLLADAGVAPEAVEGVLHATTIATNAIIERKGAPTALVTTRGFRDVLIIGRQKRYETYDLHLDKPSPLVPRRAIFEIAERVTYEGEVLAVPNEADIERAVAAIAEGGFEAVAVALLHAYANPAHEKLLQARLAERLPHVMVSLSSDVSPKFREYERTSTTVANAYVRPIVTRYVERLVAALAQRGFRRDLFVMQSSGGLVSPEIACELPIRIVESGPAAGVLLGAMVGREEGFDHVLTFDMGGTTAKLGAVDGGEPAIRPTFEVDPTRYKAGSGLPINVPAVELIEIGAGGGSIATAEMGIVKVGPESAGADPGPIAYGRGGTRPTITDANLVLGYLDPEYFNGGSMTLDINGAERGVLDGVGRPLGLGAEEAAWGVHAVANVNMERAMRIVSLERGRDPRRYALVAFGGAGPLHAARLARALGVPRVIVPHGAGVGSAIGLLQADARIDASITGVMDLTPDAVPRLVAIYDDLAARVDRDVERLGMAARPRYARSAYMRLKGQGFEIRVDLPDGPIDAGWVAAAADAFHAAYAAKYGYRDEGSGIEAVDWYLVATVPVAGEGPAPWDARTADGPAMIGHRSAWFPEAGGRIRCAVWRRALLAIDEVVDGPAVIEDPESTTLVLPGDRARLSPRGHLVIEIANAGDAR